MYVLYLYLFVIHFVHLLFICHSFVIHYDSVDDGDNVDGLDFDSHFGFSVGVVREAAVAVVIGEW